MNIIEILIIESNTFSWYSKHIGEKIFVFENKIEQIPGKFVYQHIDSDGIIECEHGLTVVEQREKKFNRLKI